MIKSLGQTYVHFWGGGDNLLFFCCNKYTIRPNTCVLQSWETQTFVHCKFCLIVGGHACILLLDPALSYHTL